MVGSEQKQWEATKNRLAYHVLQFHEARTRNLGRSSTDKSQSNRSHEIPPTTIEGNPLVSQFVETLQTFFTG